MARWLRARVRLDRTAAAALLIPLAPVLLAAAVIVRRHDRGPAFIRLRRVGRHGVHFGMWKLRTMAVGSGGTRAGGSALSVTDDQRVTAVGATLRRFRLDEIPQLLNVVRGEMSLIGPRPETPEFVALADERWSAVLAQPPGIAGLSQVLLHDWEATLLATGEPEATYREYVLPLKLALDQWYVANAGLFTDLLVLAALAERFGGGRQQTVIHRRAARFLPSEVAAMLLADSHGPLSTGDSPDG